MNALRRVARMSALRLALTLSLIFAVLLLVCGVAAQRMIDSELRAAVDADLREDHAMLAAVGARELKGLAAADLETDYTYAYFGLRDHEGRLSGPLSGDVFDRDGLFSISTSALFRSGDLAREIADYLDADGPDDVAWRVYVASAPAGRLAVFSPLEGLEQALDIVPLTMLATGGALILVTLLVGLLMGLRAQRRLDRILAGLARIARGDLSLRMAPAAPRDDLDEVMVGVDRAAARLDESMRALKDFSHNVAHDLRTPLARLRARLERAPDSEHTAAALAETDDILATFDALRRIARLNADGEPAQMAEIDLTEIAGFMVEMLGPDAEEAGQSLTLRQAGPMPARGDRQLLLQALSNLIGNALRHAGPQARVVVTATPGALIVEDDGPGVPEAERARIVEPFQRLDSSRATPGSGLGLPLAAAAARHHGGVLTLSDSPLGGLRATLTLNARLAV